MYAACLYMLGVLTVLCSAQDNIIHQPGAPQLFNELPVFGDKNLDSRLLREQLFDKTPKDTLIPPPKTVYGYAEVRDILHNALERAVNIEVVPSQHQLAVVLSILGCAAVVFCGVLPALLLPIETGAALHMGSQQLNVLLSFAVGSLLGDVFMHILPETWSKPNCGSLSFLYTYDPNFHYHHLLPLVDSICSGLWVIFGLSLCFIVEKCCSSTEESQHKAAAMLNLVANLIDNFTHGLAVAGSFLVNIRFGVLTTLAILLHEIPHEISDFAILLRADFNRWQAIKAQLLTSTGGIVGASVALAINCAALDSASVYILSFTAGGFINIALVEILPELLNENNPRESLKHLFFMILGIVVMGAVNLMHAA